MQGNLHLACLMREGPHRPNLRSCRLPGEALETALKQNGDFLETAWRCVEFINEPRCPRPDPLPERQKLRPCCLITGAFGENRAIIAINSSRPRSGSTRKGSIQAKFQVAQRAERRR